MTVYRFPEKKQDIDFLCMAEQIELDDEGREIVIEEINLSYLFTDLLKDPEGFDEDEIDIRLQWLATGISSKMNSVKGELNWNINVVNDHLDDETFEEFRDKLLEFIANKLIEINQIESEEEF